MAHVITRRQLLRWGAAGGAALVLPTAGLIGCGGEDDFAGVPAPTATPFPPTPTPTPIPSFLSADELAVVRAVAARIVPTDELLPGATEAGGADYIDQLLSVVPDNSAPAGMVFGGGPFSNRNPFPDPATGTPSSTFPSDDFTQFIPLTRLQLMSWRVRLLGTAAVPGSDFNVPALPPVIGWRDQYRSGIAGIESASQDMFGGGFATLTADQQDEVLGAIDAGFFGLIRGHTLEGMFCAPEYGGNQNLVGWKLIGYDGDSQPLGYSIFNETMMTYEERLDKPNSTANPNEDFSGVDAVTQSFLKALVKVVGTPHFP